MRAVKKEASKRGVGKAVDTHKALLQAIRRIPTAPNRPWNAQQAMEWVVQCALVGLIASANQRGTHLVSHYDPDGMGFTPMTKRMPPPEVMLAVEAYLQAVRDSRPFEDILVLVHAELLAVKGGEGLGQFFTPPDLCELLEESVMSERQDHPGNPHRLAIHDPVCGAGGMLLAAVRAGLAERPSDEIEVEAVDLDPFCVAMTALQFQAAQHIHSLPLKRCRVFQGNVLLPLDRLTCLFKSKLSAPFVYDRAKRAFAGMLC